MNIMIINCHWNNRGDESAIRAMIDELKVCFPGVHFYVQCATGTFIDFPKIDNTEVLDAFPSGKRHIVSDMIAAFTRGRVCLNANARQFFNALNNSAVVLHAPGGPSIGDIYLKNEKRKLLRLLSVKWAGVPYVFYAPSMGPFNNRTRNIFRKKILKGAKLICLREELSKKMVKDFIPELEPVVTLDSAFQHDIDISGNSELLRSYTELNEFISDKNVIGITVTDLQWNSKYKGNAEIQETIRDTFNSFVLRLTGEGYKVLFIPQLFGGANDYEYMSTFRINDNVFVMSDKYDCYFQQYIISRLKAVIGMRYHSNIFSAKMGTPFISVSYEQKMVGFMEKAELMKYCININELSSEVLNEKFDLLLSSYDDYKSELAKKRVQFKEQSHKTTDLVAQIINDELAKN